MKSLAASISFISLLCCFSLLVRNQSEASDSPHIPTTLSTPGKFEPGTASPTPACTPQSFPENEKNDPVREMTAENALDASLGTTDWDCDGIRNIKDNCIFAYNPDQKDGNGDGKGDVCDPSLVDPKFRDSRCDQDLDGVPDLTDNCIVVCNPDQKDINKNGTGDVCDRAFPNAVLTLQVCEKVRKVEEPTPPKSSTDKWINPCEGDPGCDPFGEIYKRYLRLDTDGDGTPDFKDNCPMTCNPNQKDANKNGIGDACEQALGNSPYGSKPCRRKIRLG